MRQKILFFCILSLSACSGEPPKQEHPPTAAAVTPAPPAPPAPPAYQHDIVEHALSAVGVSYRRGGESPGGGFDCSGLIVHVYREALGVSLPHNALAQSGAGRHVDAADLEPGDLVFYNTRNRKYSHVGLYLGDGRFVHAPKPGAAVRVEKMSSSYWSRRYNGARRIAGEEVPPSAAR